MEEIILHEMLDCAAAALVAIAKALGNLNLQVKGQLIHSPAGDQMQMTAHRPEKVLGLFQTLELVRAKHAKTGQLAGSGDAKHIFCNPVQ